MKKLIVDLDNTITLGDTNDYEKVSPNTPVIEQLREYRNQGFQIVINTARNMRTFSGNVGKINIHTLPIITQWLDEHDVPYDEVLVGKPWCGKEGFYIDDRSVRPSEFAKMTFDEITALLEKEKLEIQNLCS
ncbi:putative capsular polysaccharide biosynthesis protein [Grimontia indica]|uniref:Capsular polysaccharide biosynthesis protein n=1 Tax=Grimontia indica TaxID=1056512 RepID=R1IW61_9GAMM|nr:MULTISPECIES: capsular polysaccharide biosynthesis protein [Grimontia]EOD81722.1 putative capsular polysaccharide biosynthesis protein [Grimontia indica]